MPGFLGRIVARMAGIPVILHHQAGWTVTSYSSVLERLFFTLLEYLAALASTKSLCVSHVIAQQAQRLHTAPRRKLVTICNGIDPQRFISVSDKAIRIRTRRSLAIPEDHLVIGNTGRLVPEKDNETLIRSLLPLHSLIPESPFTLVLVGEGPERENLENLARSLGLSDKVLFLGFRKDIPALLAAMDIFAYPSLREGLSISLLEAMAAAKFVVASSIPPNAELIQPDSTGLLVPMKSPHHMARAIAWFVQNPRLAQRLAMTARHRVLAHYTLERTLQEAWDLYRKMFKEKVV